MIGLPRLHVKGLITGMPVVRNNVTVELSATHLTTTITGRNNVNLVTTSNLPFSRLQCRVRLTEGLSPANVVNVGTVMTTARFTNLMGATVRRNVSLMMTNTNFSESVFTVNGRSNAPVMPVISSTGLTHVSRNLNTTTMVMRNYRTNKRLKASHSTQRVIPRIMTTMGGVPMVTTNNILSNHSVIRVLGVNTDNIRVNDHFTTSSRYGTSSRLGGVCMQTAGPRSVMLVRDPINLPNRTVGGGFTRSILSNAMTPPAIYSGYLGRYSRGFYVVHTLSHTRRNSIRAKLIFSNGGVEGISEVVPIGSVFTRLGRRMTRVSWFGKLCDCGE